LAHPQIFILVVLDGELAVPCSPRSAHAGLNSLLKDCSVVDCGEKVGGIGLHATDACELRQVRKEAAVNKAVRVVAVSNLEPLFHAPNDGGSDGGCTARVFFDHLF
jgi:hypothetical protein